MTTRDTLIFSGRRWPGVVQASRGVLITGRRRQTGSARPLPPQFVFVASGGGQQWDTDRPMAFWRNFAALTDKAEALRFIARHGDPFGHLDGESTHPNRPPVGTTEPSFALMDALEQIAAAC